MVSRLEEEIVVEARKLSVTYGRDLALDELSFSLVRGRVLAVVGANGAGKSTLFRALLGLLPITSGAARILGRAPHDLCDADRARIAYVSERHAELAHARVDAIVEFRASMYPRFDRTLFEQLARELALPMRAVVGELSQGQRASAVVGLAIAQRPELVLLDDPTLGLDPLARRRVIQTLLAATREREISVLVATHELSDVERVADDLVLLTRGRSSGAIELEQFVASACACVVPMTTDRAALSAIHGVLHVWPRRSGHELVIRGNADERAAALDRAAEITGVAAEPREVTFEELALAWLASAERRAA